MQDDAAFNQDKKPWDNRERIVPLRTFSGRVVYKRKKHTWAARDVERILRKLEPPPDVDPGWWGYKVIELIQFATIAMIQRILWFLPPGIGTVLYRFAIQLLDMMFRSAMSKDGKARVSRDVIWEVAQRNGWVVEITGDK